MKICMWHISEFGALFNISASTILQLRRNQSLKVHLQVMFRTIFVRVTKYVTSIFQSLKVTISSHVFNAIFASVQQDVCNKYFLKRKSKTQKINKLINKRIVKSLTKWEIAYGYEILSMMLQWDYQTPTRFGGCTYNMRCSNLYS